MNPQTPARGATHPEMPVEPVAPGVAQILVYVDVITVDRVDPDVAPREIGVDLEGRPRASVFRLILFSLPFHVRVRSFPYRQAKRREPLAPARLSLPPIELLIVHERYCMLLEGRYQWRFHDNDSPNPTFPMTTAPSKPDWSPIETCLTHVGEHLCPNQVVVSLRTAEPPPADAWLPHDPVLQIVLTGQLPTTVHGLKGLDRHVLCPGDMLFCCEETWSMREYHHARSLLSVILSSDGPRYALYERQADDPRNRPPRAWYHGERLPDHIRSLLRCIHETLPLEGTSSQAGPWLIRSLVPLLLDTGRAARAGASSRRGLKGVRLVRQIRDFLVENLHQAPTREQVAKTFALTPDHLGRLMKQHAGVTFNEELTTLRLQRALRLVEDPRLSVKEIAFRSGFGSAAYFIRCFRRRYGCSPGLYRCRGT